MDDIRCKHRRRLTCLIEVGTDYRGIDLFEQLHHTGHTIVKLMVTQCDGMIVHVAHDVNDILSLRDGTSGVTLQEVTHTDSTHIGRISAVNGIAQSSHLRISVDAAMRIILIKDYDTLLSHHHLTAHHHRQQYKMDFFHFTLWFL